MNKLISYGLEVTCVFHRQRFPLEDVLSSSRSIKLSIESRGEARMEEVESGCLRHPSKISARAGFVQWLRSQSVRGPAVT